jgi:fucose permease
LTEAASPAAGGNISKTIGYYVAFIALGLAAASLGPTLPGLAENTQTRLSQISLLFVTHSSGYLVGSFLGGRLYDRVPGHRVMVGVLLVMVGMMVLVPLNSTLWLLATVWLVLGVAMGTLDVGGNTLLVWVHRRQVGPFMNGLHFFFGVGAFLSPIIIARLVSISGDLTWAYWALAVLMLPGLIWLSRQSSPAPQSDAEDGRQRGGNRLLITLVALFFFLHVGAEISFGGWIFTYAMAMDLSSEAAAAYLTSGFWGALTLSRLLTIPIAARVRPRSILLASLAGCLISVSIILLWPYSSVAVWLGALGMGLSVASIFPSSFSLAERNMTITGRVSGWFIVGASLGSISLPWIIGQLFERIGPRVTMFAIAIAITLALGVFALVLLRLPRPLNPRSSPRMDS